MDVLDYLQEHGIQSLIDEFGIKVKEYDDRYLLNYDQIESAPYRFSQIVRECRNLIISKDFSTVLHRSFDRFFNWNEDPQTALFNLSTMIVDEKLDGSLIGFYHDGKKWCFCTRGTAFAEAELQYPEIISQRYGWKPKTFLDLICQTIGHDLENIQKISLDKEFSYIFELISPYNRVVTEYRHSSLSLLAVRNKTTGHYEDRNVWYQETMLGRICSGPPRTYTFEFEQDVFDNLHLLNPFDEGYVCWQKNNGNYWHIKIKNPAYLAIAHLRGNGELNPKRVIELVATFNEQEYLLSFPEDKEYFNRYIAIRDCLYSEWKDGTGKGYYDAVYEQVKNIKEQKEFALAIKDQPMSSILFKMRQYDKPFAEIAGIMSKSNPNFFVKLYDKWFLEALNIQKEEEINEIPF